MRRGAGALVAAAAGAAVLAWVLCPRAEAPLGIGTAGGTRAAPSGAVPVPPPPAPSPGSRSEGAGDPSTRPGDPAGSGAQTHLVRGRVTGLDRTLLGDVRVEVEALGNSRTPLGPGVGAGMEPDGSYVADVSDFFAEGRVPEDLEVRASHPSCRPGSSRIAVRDARVAAGVRPVVFEADVALERGGVVTGRVVDEQGRPVPEAAVTLHPAGRGGPDPTPLAGGATDAEGRFRLVAGRVGAAYAVASKDGFRPTAVEVSVAIGREGDVGSLALGPGAAISGSVRASFDLPAKAWTLTARVPGVTRGIVLESSDEAPGREWLLWLDGRPEAMHPDSATDGDGQFRIGGLRPGPYELRFAMANRSEIRVLLDAAQDFRRTVEAPAEGIEVAVPIARLVIEVAGPGGPLREADVHLSSKRAGLGTQADERGRLDFLVRPDSPYLLKVEAEGHEPQSREVLSPPAGGERTERVELTAIQRGRATLALRLRGPAGERIERASVRLVPRFQGGQERGWHPDSADADGAFRLAELDAGLWDLSVRPGGDVAGGYWCEATTSADLSAGGEREVVLDCRRGGRLRIAARDPEGRLLRARAVLRDAAGVDLRPFFLSRTPRGILAGSDWLHNSTPSEVDPPLPPGRYRLELSHDGFRAASREVEVREGETAEVDILMISE